MKFTRYLCISAQFEIIQRKMAGEHFNGLYTMKKAEWQKSG